MSAHLLSFLLVWIIACVVASLSEYFHVIKGVNTHLLEGEIWDFGNSLKFGTSSSSLFLSLYQKNQVQINSFNARFIILHMEDGKYKSINRSQNQKDKMERTMVFVQENDIFVIALSSKPDTLPDSLDSFTSPVNDGDLTDLMGDYEESGIAIVCVKYSAQHPPQQVQSTSGQTRLYLKRIAGKETPNLSHGYVDESSHMCIYHNKIFDNSNIMLKVSDSMAQIIGRGYTSLLVIRNSSVVPLPFPYDLPFKLKYFHIMLRSNDMVVALSSEESILDSQSLAYLLTLFTTTSQASLQESLNNDKSIKDLGILVSIVESDKDAPIQS